MIDTTTTQVFIVMSGAILDDYPHEFLTKDQPALDSRWSNTFIKGPIGSGVESVTVNVDRWFSPKAFFTEVKRIWDDGDLELREISRTDDVVECNHSLNTWLAIVDYFGLDRQYTNWFMTKIYSVIDPIRQLAYKKEATDTTRIFHGKEYTDDEFFREFSAFLARHGVIPE